MHPRRFPALLAAVLALSVIACTKAPDSDPSSSLAPSPSPVERPVVQNLAIAEPDWKADGSNWALELTWDAPEGFEVDHYVVTRDGVEAGDDVTATRWNDRDAEPGARVAYTVTAFDPDGRRSKPAKASIKAGAPAVDDARLDGSFFMRMRVDKATGTRDPVSGGAVIFRFDPACAKGPCAVRWTVRDRQTDAMLPRKGARYAATVSTPLFITSCFGSVIDESVGVDLRVTAAAPVHGSWRATKIEGTVHERSTASGCMSASIDWNVRGVVQT